MNQQIILPFIALVIVIMGVKYYTENLQKKLSIEKKEELFQIFSKLRVFNLVSIAGIFIIFFVLTKYQIGSLSNNLLIYMATIILYFSYGLIFNYKNLKTYNFPSDFIAPYTVANGLRIVCFAIIFVYIWLIMPKV